MLHSFAYTGDAAVGAVLCQNLLAAGFEQQDDIAAADVVIAYCASQESHEETYFGQDGLLSHLREGLFIIGLGACTPTTAREISSLAQVSDAHFVEAPLHAADITVPDPFADRDNLTALLAGQPDELAQVTGIIEAVAAHWEECGQSGAAQAVKCALTAKRALEIASMVESEALLRLAVDESGELQARAFLESQQGTQENISAWYQGIRADNYASTYTIEIVASELTCALAWAEEQGLVLPQTETAAYLVRLLATVGGIELSPLALTLAYRDEASGERFGLDWHRAEGMQTLSDTDDNDDDEMDDREGWGWTSDEELGIEEDSPLGR